MLFKYFLKVNGPNKITFRNFEILKIETLTIFLVFVNMGPVRE